MLIACKKIVLEIVSDDTKKTVLNRFK